MPLTLSHLLCTVLLSLLLQVAGGQNPAPPAAEQQPIKVNTTDVLLDVLVKDKKDRPVRDLKPEEIEVYEDGVKQTLDSVRLISFETEKKGASKNGESRPPVPASLQQINLVTLVFDRFDAIHNQSARSAASDYLDKTLNDHMFVRVMVAGSKLYVIEQFTNDRKKIEQAIAKATVSTEKSQVEASDRITNSLKGLTQATTPTANEILEITLARLTLNTLEQAKKVPQVSKAAAPIFSLLYVARAQQNLAGRKFVVYFANRPYIQPGLKDVLQSTISEANRGNVSFYAVDVPRAIFGAGIQSRRLENAEVRSETTSSPSAFFSDRRSTFLMFEGLERKQTQGKVGDLRSLSEETGGFVIDDSLDFNGALRRLTADLSTYYALAYTPSKQEYDGKFRAIIVKILRPGVKTQTRSGYFALPPAASALPVLSYETPLLAALHKPVMPHDFAFHSATFHFATREQETQCTFALEVPLANFIHPETRPENKNSKAQTIHFSLLGIIRNEQGEVVQRFSETHPAEIPLKQLEAIKREQFLLQRHFWLSPGTYTFEAALHDVQTGELSAQRSTFTIPVPSAGLPTASLFLVKQVESVEDAAAETDNPLVTQNKLLVPRTNKTLLLSAEPELSFHLAIYSAEKQPAEKRTATTAKIELLREDKVIASSQPALPKADASGRISFAAGIPTKGLEPGSYQLRALIKQDDQTAEEVISFNLTGVNRPPLAADKETDKVLTSALSLTDATGELALSALKEATPFDLPVNTLLQEVQQNGARMFKQLGGYTYSLRKVRRVLDMKGRIREEEFKDYEAYPVKGRHALIQLSDNGQGLTIDSIKVDRKQATEALIRDEEAKSKANEGSTQKSGASFWGASLSGFAKRNKYVYIVIDPAVFFSACEFSGPRVGLLEGRETIFLNFKPRTGVKLENHHAWVGQLEGNIWLDVADRSLVRIEGKEIASAASTTKPVLNFVYQQNRLPEGVWSPHLIRINSGGNETIFNGLNWDAWFEFNNYKRFDSQGSDLKLIIPDEKKPEKKLER